MRKPKEPLTLYTIGHSTRTFAEFLELLQAFNINHLVDIRTIPKSRYVPWFNQGPLSATLRKDKVGYTHLAQLGGLRHARKDSHNLGWRNASFRGFADYMETAEFQEGLQQLNQLIQTERVAIMCAEAVPWRCHRSLIADAEIIQNITVQHIMGLNSLKLHEITPFAKVIRKHPPLIHYLAENKGAKNNEHLV